MSSFDTLRVKVGRRPITIVELDLDYCQNTYGVAPCAAILGTTGTAKCYNTYKSCQDTANFNKGTKTYKFCSDIGFLPGGENLYPCITDVDIAPTQLNPKGFSVTASVTVTMRDFPHHDRGVDRYTDDRDGPPEGSFFGRLRGRNPYLINRVMRVSTGYVDADRVVYTRSRTYFVDRMEGPDANGRVRLVGKDVLRFAEAEKAQAPVASQGILSANINNSVTSLTLVPAGIGAEYPSSGTVRIGDELITYSSKSTDTLNGLTRGTDGTTAVAHDADDAVQLCIRYAAEYIPDILYDLLVNYAGIDPSYIPLSDWIDEADLWIGSFNASVVLSEPAGVKDLVDEILESTGCALWWDEVDAELKFKVIVPLEAEDAVPLLDETQHILTGSLSVKDLEKERVSRVIIYHDLKDVTGSLDRANFRTISVQLDATGEGVNAYGTPLTYEVLNRWVPSEALASEIGTRLLARYRETPRELTFRLDAKDATLKTGDLVDVETRLVQAFDGSPSVLRYIVLETREVEIGTHHEYRVMQVSTTGGQGPAAVIAPDAMDDWTAASDADRAKYMFIGSDAGVMSDLEPAPKIS